MSQPAPPPALVVPVKAFTEAKARLAPVLDPEHRAALARRMAEGVVAAAGTRRIVIACDDDEVRTWAAALALEVAWTPGHDLSGAVTAAVELLAATGAAVVGVAHADLPFPARLPSVVDRGTPASVVVVADRVRDGTNVLVVPAAAGFRFAYGPGSFGRHLAEARRVGLEVDVIDDPALAWDLDDPDDLDPPPGLGDPPWVRSDG